MADDSLQTYLDHLVTIAVDRDTFRLDSDGTLVLPDDLAVAEPEVQPGPRLVLAETIGEGGMGVVRAGTQVALDRPIAVKTLQEGKDSPGARRRVLREAWVTGRLQHPNIVPIYALERDEEGRPVIAMKRIEGLPWSALLQEPDRHVEAFRGERDKRGFHLGVLDAVCLAVHYAHTEGVIHRDLKPDNVMLGAFGEVYVVDWGLAVGIGDAPDARLPAARDLAGVEGTPGYLSPEMAAGDGARIGVGSDVFLLGAILHEVLTGRARHQGDSLTETLAAAFSVRPVDYDDDVPVELATIANRATAAQPEDRYPDVESFRRAVAAFRDHQASAVLVAEAREPGTALLDLVEQELASGSVDVVEVARLGAEARLAYRLALRHWPGNELAAVGLREVVEALCAHELRNENRSAAAALLAALDAPPEALVVGLRDLDGTLAARADEQAGLERLQEAVDLRRGARARARVSLMMGAVTGALGVSMQVVQSSGLAQLGYESYAVLVGAFIGVSLVFSFRARHRAQNLASRQQSAIISLGQSAVVVCGLFGWLYGLPIANTLSMAMAIAGLMSGVFAELFFPRMRAGALAYLATVPPLMLWPALCWLWVAVGCMGGFGFLALGWRWEATAQRR